MKARRSLLAAAFSASLAVLAAGCAAELDTAQQPLQSPATAVASPVAPAPQTTQPAGDIDPAASMDAAISAWLAEEGIGYAGACDDTDRSDLGQYCSAIFEDRDAAVVVKIGPAGSEYDSWLLVKRSDDGWLVVRKADMPAPGGQTEETPPF